MSIPFEPATGYMLCEEPQHEESKAGIVILASEEEGEPLKMKVVMVGPGEVTETGHQHKVEVVPGDVCYVILPRYALTSKVRFGDKNYVIVQSKFVVGKKP